MNQLVGRKILVVDDDQFLREVIVDLLSSTGADMFEAENGTIAFEMVQKMSPDIVVTDVRMPGGDGIELSQNIANMSGHRPVVIMCSGYNDLTPQRIEELGIRKYFEKPFEPDEFTDFIGNLFSAPKTMPKPN